MGGRANSTPMRDMTMVTWTALAMPTAAKSRAESRPAMTVSMTPLAIQAIWEM